jgi:outer membrane biosynthesis protein TonB
VVDEKQRAFALHGFSVPASFTLASSEGKAFRVSVPPGAKVERLRQDGHFTEARGNEVPRGTAASVTLGVGEAAQFVQGTMRLRAYVAPPPERFFGNPFKGMPWLALFFLLLSAGGFGYFLSRVPPEPELPDFNAQELAPVAVRLLKPKPKPKPKKKPEPMRAEKDKPKVEEKKVAEAKPKPRPVAKVTPKPQPKPEPPAAPEVKALKALAKLSAAGPAMHDMLAAVDKLGNGPGKKNAKSVSYKLSGLVGKAPIANAGLGHFGLGGGGKGGIGTLGAELLHGKGGGGIGAMGAGSVGRGKIGGRVSQAVARKIAASGNIDREAVARTVNQHLQEVRACYERQLLKDPGLAGKVVLEWTISTTGRVVQARTKTSSLHNASVESCILASLKGWHFPSARGGLVIVSYPFLFNAVGY